MQGLGALWVILNRTAGTSRATGRPVRSKEPREASRRALGCGIKGGRERAVLRRRDAVLAGVTGRGCVYIFVWVKALLCKAGPWVDPSGSGLAPG